MTAKIIFIISFIGTLFLVDIKPDACTPLAILCAAAMIVSTTEEKK